jgi:hypothetical protein
VYVSDDDATVPRTFKQRTPAFYRLLSDDRRRYSGNSSNYADYSRNTTGESLSLCCHICSQEITYRWCHLYRPEIYCTAVSNRLLRVYYMLYHKHLLMVLCKHATIIDVCNVMQVDMQTRVMKICMM